VKLGLARVDGHLCPEPEVSPRFQREIRESGGRRGLARAGRVRNGDSGDACLKAYEKRTRQHEELVLGEPTLLLLIDVEE
jgi:hypothetical protein